VKYKILSLCFILFITGWILAQTGPSFEKYFIDKTIRLDYFHTGTHNQETYSYDAIFQEPTWAGSKINLIDTLNLGKYLFKVLDVKTNQMIYSRGFSSIFGEWQTTDEARRGIYRTFSESIRFPWPKERVKVTIGTRDRYNIFHDTWDFVIDPDEPNIRRVNYFSDARVTKLVHHGDSYKKVDLVILPDGYTQEEMKKFREDAHRLLKVLFDTSPFKERKKDFNVWAVEVPSKESGIDNPQKGEYVDNILSCSFNAFGSDRYALTWDNKTVRKAAARAPYDHLYILFNESKYGGGGIFNLYATSYVDGQWSGYVFVHEFGHHFAGLGDEYYTSDVAYTDFYPSGVEPWEPNVTTFVDKNHIKWQYLMEPETPVPTSWGKDEYDEHQKEYRIQRRKLSKNDAPQAKIDSLSTANARWVHDFLHSQEYMGKVGVFEGSGYASQGLYRPSIDCIMFSRNAGEFDPVCRSAIENVINFYTQ